MKWIVPFLLVVAIVPLAGQSGAKNGEWPTYGGDLGNTRYSPLDQINADNFSKLEVAWRFKTDSLGPRPEYQVRVDAADGRTASSTRPAGTRRAVVALDAATGELLWMHSEHEGAARRGGAAAALGPRPRLLDRRQGGADPLRHARLSARRARREDRHARSPSFGKNGIVDLKQDNDQTIDLVTGEIGLHATPVVAGNVVIVGAAHLSGGVPRGKTQREGLHPRLRRADRQAAVDLPHDSAAGRVRQRHLAERLVVVHRQHRRRGRRSSVDEELGLVYLPVEAPTGDYYGGHRPGNNLFGESLVAVDLKTGKRKWHYQLVHHGIWDHDIPCAPILVDITVNGKPIKALAQPTKQALLYVFDRVTGQPVWPIEERPVEKGDVPGEWYSPTQPFPLDASGQPFDTIARASRSTI